MSGATAEQTSPFHNDCLYGNVAIVTGGGSGICHEIARQLVLHGCSVVVAGRREPFLQKATASLNQLCSTTHGVSAAYHVCDVRNADSCQTLVDFAVSKYGKVSVLVNGAAGNFLSEASSLKPKGFKTVMEIDAQGTFNMCHAAYPYLKKSGNASIINISATLQYGATWFQVHASAAKAAVDSVTRTLALEWGADNIRVNGIAPGPIADTPGTTKLAPGLDSSDVSDMVSEGIPIGRMGQAWDIGMASVFLCSAAASYVTGDVLVVDGAQWLYKPPLVPREMVTELSRKVEKKSRDQQPGSFRAKL
mmetsp:Transcript_589/g.966  ORF Transcript_589/g.966 Transcript_589/m.966 type:complete len:306 (-) Transcript_589:68-985(-)|eukprot:CAMPEP_0196812840 /NCGR_PEP_ID=MMETSP1362-20130617/31680_1 /TAXON_ID=163516 /ORGANISM="Leptocylindrus danicus, Strain CCMP1856" /LENGTH=305 /DNA_ID=CAMNT_0042188765 /DNA_START=29 /DNA_END=946 /DNA_ORIENTATION=-